MNKDKKLAAEHQTQCQQNQCEKITISRMESQRARMRKTTDKGTDVAVIMPQGTVLRNGDVIHQTKDDMIVVEIEPESVAVLTFEAKDAEQVELFALATKIGHALGNMHRPIKINGEKIYLPIQADSEIELLNKIFQPIHDHLSITKTKMVFEPEEGMHVHEHG